MTLEEAIERYEKLSKEYEEKIIHNERFGNMPCVDKGNVFYRNKSEEYRQLAEWLKELKKYREKDRYNNYDICLGGFHLD